MGPAIIALLAAALTAPARAADAPASVADLVAKLPAESPQAGQQVLDEILKRGPAALGEVAGMVLAPGAGNDAKARFTQIGRASCRERV